MPGQIYSVVEIAAEVGVSRTPVTEAIKRLAEREVVVLHPSVGFEVRRHTVQEIEDIFTLRAELEAFAMRRALTQGISERELRLLEENTDACLAAAKAGDYPAFSRLSIEYHTRLYGLANIPRLSAIMKDLKDLWLHEVWFSSAFERDTSAFLPLLEGHREIIRCLREGADDRQVREVCEHHYEQCISVIRKEIEDGARL